MRNLIPAVMLAMTSLLDMATQADDCIASEEYAELSSPVLVPQPSKIEVVELFWCGYPHCYAFEPAIVPWSERSPVGIHFVRLPALFGSIWSVHGQTFLTLENMGIEHDVYNAAFEVTHREHRKLAIPEEMADFLTDKGVDKEKFLSTYNFFVIKGQVEKAKKLTVACQVTGVSTMVINDKYHFDIGSAGGPEETLKLTDYLIGEERAAIKRQAR